MRFRAVIKCLYRIETLDRKGSFGVAQAAEDGSARGKRRIGEGESG